MAPELAEAPLLERVRPNASSTATITATAPIVPVRNVGSSITFYQRVLGFDVLSRNTDQSAAVVARGPLRLMLLRVGQKQALQATREHLSLYVWVDDLASLWEEFREGLSLLPAWRVRKPFRQPYGALEFHVKDPDGFLLFFAADPEARRASDGFVEHDARDGAARRPN
ncbi:MAG: VOC family protein [Pseudomonadota bacterium]